MEKILDLSKVPKEVLLILEFLKEERELATQKRMAKEVDWQLFIDYTVHHRVYPLLYQKLSKSEEPLVPNFVLDRLKQLHQKNTLKMLQLTGEMIFINSLLHQNDIQVIFLKGPILANDLYGDISLRTSGDLDFLIPLGQLDYTERILLTHGYTRKDNMNRILFAWKFRSHHVTFIHPSKKTTLEVHWKLHPGPTKEEKFENLWDRKRIAKISNFPIYHLGEKDLLHFLIIHGYRHGWYRLRWLSDIQKFSLRSQDNMIAFLSTKNRNYKLPFSQTLILLDQLLAVKFIKNDLPFLNKKTMILAQKTIYYLERKEDLHSPSSSLELRNFHKQYLLYNHSLLTKIFRLIGKLYPSVNDFQTIKLPRYLHLLYFPLRPFLLIYRKLRKPLVGNTK